MRVKSLVSIFVIALMVFGLSLSLSTQDAKAQADHAAGFGCFIFLTDIGCGAILTEDSRVVRSKSGNVMFQCRADLPVGCAAPDRAIWLSSAGCETTFGPTQDVTKLVTPSGNVTLKCRINPNQSNQ